MISSYRLCLEKEGLSRGIWQGGFCGEGDWLGLFLWWGGLVGDLWPLVLKMGPVRLKNGVLGVGVSHFS